MFYDFLFRRGKHKELETQRKIAYGGRTQLGRIGSLNSLISFGSFRSDMGGGSSRSDRGVGSGRSARRRSTLMSMVGFRNKRNDDDDSIKSERDANGNTKGYSDGESGSLKLSSSIKHDNNEDETIYF